MSLQRKLFALCLCSLLSSCSEPASQHQALAAGGPASDICASADVSVRDTASSFVLRKGLLQVTAANRSGEFVALGDGNVFVFKPHSSPERIALRSGLAGLSLSEAGTVALMETDVAKNEAPVRLHVLGNGRETFGPWFQLQSGEAPQTWPMLYFVGQRLYLSEQRGKLTAIEVNGGALGTPVIVAAPSQSVDLTAALAGGGYLQYRWNTAAERGPNAASSIVYFPDLNALRSGSGVPTEIDLPLLAWGDLGDRLILLTLSVSSPKPAPRVHLVRKADGQEIAHLDYPSKYCDVTAFDVVGDGKEIAILVKAGLIQMVDSRDFRVLRQYRLPDGAEYSSARTINSVGPDKFLVRTAGGVVELNARD